MYLWQIEYNLKKKDALISKVVNRFKLCIFDRLNTTNCLKCTTTYWLWIALNYVSLTDWIQLHIQRQLWQGVVNRFKLCIFDRLNTTHYHIWIVFQYITTNFTIKILYSILKSELKKFGLFWFYSVLFLPSIEPKIDYEFVIFFLFLPQKRNRKLAAADKSAKIMILSLNKLYRRIKILQTINNIMKQQITARILMRLYSLRQLFVLNTPVS